MNNSLSVLIATGLLLCCSILRGEDDAQQVADQEHEVKRAREVLIHATVYGFGNKLGQTEKRETDAAIEVLLATENAGEQFFLVFQQGQTCGKLFALYGLLKVRDPRFRILTSTLSRTEIVKTRFGCVVGQQKVGRLLDGIQFNPDDVPKLMNQLQDPERSIRRVPLACRQCECGGARNSVGNCGQSKQQSNHPWADIGPARWAFIRIHHVLRRLSIS